MKKYTSFAFTTSQQQCHGAWQYEPPGGNAVGFELRSHINRDLLCACCGIRIGHGLDDINMGLGGQPGTQYRQLGKACRIPIQLGSVSER